MKNINNKLTKTSSSEHRTIEKSISEISYKTLFFKSVFKNAPNLLSFIPGANIASASIQTVVGIATDYYDTLINEKRLNEMQSFDKELDKRLSKLEIKDQAKDYWENTLVFKREDIIRKLMTEPGKGFDILLAEFIAFALGDLNTPSTAKDLVLSSLLEIDNVDLTVLKEIDLQFKLNLKSDKALGVEFKFLSETLKPKIDNIMISRSIQRLESQDLIAPLTRNNPVLSERPSLEGLLEGEKSPQYYSQGGFVITAFGRRFLRFLKLSD